MNFVNLWLSKSIEAGIRSKASSRIVAVNVATMPTANPTESASAERCDQRPVAVDERHADPGDRPEVRAHHHGADDQDRLVEVDPDRCDQHRQDHEEQVAVRELHVLGGPRCDVLPDDRVGADVVTPAALRVLGDAGDLGVDLVDRDRAVAVDVELAQVGDQQADVAPGDVALDQVALGLARHAGEVDDVEDRVGVVEQLEHVLAVAGRRDDPEVHHAPMVRGARRTRG